LIFEPYACDLAKRVADTAPKDVLETAAGTGVLTRAMAARLPATVLIVATQFGTMFFPDKVAGYKEARRILRSGGHFIFNVWDRISENEFADVVTQALAVIFPNDPPRFMARTPHGYHDVEQIREQLRAADFAEIAIDAVSEKSKAPSPRDAAVGFCEGTPLRNEIEARDASGLEHATAQATAALARRFGNGPIEGRIRAFVISAA
jgi:ubiquinone/menaquinone biosynthesis C-methylase UbiE